MKKHFLVLLITSLPLAAMDNEPTSIESGVEAEMVAGESEKLLPAITKTTLDTILKRYTRAKISFEQFSESEQREKRMFLSEALCGIMQSFFWATRNCSNESVDTLKNNLTFILGTFNVELTQEYAFDGIHTIHRIIQRKENSELIIDQRETSSAYIMSPLKTLIKFDLLPILQLLKALRPNTFTNKYLLRQMLSYGSYQPESKIKVELAISLQGL